MASTGSGHTRSVRGTVGSKGGGGRSGRRCPSCDHADGTKPRDGPQGASGVPTRKVTSDWGEGARKRLWGALGAGRVLNLESGQGRASWESGQHSTALGLSHRVHTCCRENVNPESQADRRAGGRDARASSGRRWEAETEMHGATASNSQGSTEALRQETPPFSLCRKSCSEPKGLREGSVGLPCSLVCPRPQAIPGHRAETQGLLPDRQQGRLAARRNVSTCGSSAVPQARANACTRTLSPSHRPRARG